MSKLVRYNIRIDDMVTNQIYPFPNEQNPIFNGGDGKLYRMKIISGELTQQEVTITDGQLVETGDPITYQQKS